MLKAWYKMKILYLLEEHFLIALPGGTQLALIA